MTALERLRERASHGIIGLLWINLAMIALRSGLRAEGFDFATLTAATVVVVLSTLAWHRDHCGPATRAITSMAHATTVALLVYSFSGSPLQIDVHMYFFASLAICAAWIDWRAIVSFAALVAVHHLLLYVAAPFAVFPGESHFSRVVLHAAVLVAQSSALIALTSAMAKAFATAEQSVAQAQAAERETSLMAERARLADAEAAKQREERALLRAKAHEATTFAVDTLRAALSKLADGDVSVRISRDFEDHLNELGHAFNRSVEQLEGVLRRVGDVALSVRQGSTQISDANGDLSRRTERQAASVTQTAGALSEALETVRATSALAATVGSMVRKASAGAEQSGHIVTETVAAMMKIDTSSQEIGKIIGVIDEIAFQTNLLALNAGVEAARAGDAGKGFAVVAQEVRELAQRSAAAAKDIKHLVGTCTDHVSNGVAMVGKTGDALRAIAGDVAEISGHLEGIVERSREQLTSLDGIGAAIADIDRTMQQNTAMVEETSAAIGTVADEANLLEQLIGRFSVGEQPPHRNAA